MDKKINTDLIKKFLEGKCSEEEWAEVHSLKEEPSFEAELEKLFESHWQEGVPQAETDHPENDNVKPISSTQALDDEIKKRRLSIPAFLRYASIFLIIISFPLLILYLNNKSENDKLVESGSAEFTTDRGERQSLYLMDSSLVVLNSSSKLTVSAGYLKKDRKVDLSGEAFFSVQHLPKKPFIISANDLEVKVLGTEFIVNSSSDFFVAVKKGRVEVALKSNPQFPITLHEGEISYLDEKGELRKSKSYDKKLFYWIDNKLYFDDANFEEIVERLGAWYNIEITVQGNPTAKHYTGTFTQESLGNVLESISYVLGFDYTISGSNVDITYLKQ